MSEPLIIFEGADPALEAAVRREMQARYRGYLVLVGVISLAVGWIVATFTPRAPAAQALTPPPQWSAAACLPLSATMPFPTVTPQPLQVYVSGAVAAAQVVTLPAGSLLADALAAVGGPTADANLDKLNLAAPLSNHQHILVPRRTTAAATGAPALTGTPGSGGALINLNTATAVELETLPHVGPALAQRILDYRAANGPFARVEDLQNVAGIGPATYADLAPLVTVGP